MVLLSTAAETTATVKPVPVTVIITGVENSSFLVICLGSGSLRTRTAGFQFRHATAGPRIANGTTNCTHHTRSTPNRLKSQSPCSCTYYTCPILLSGRSRRRPASTAAFGRPLHHRACQLGPHYFQTGCCGCREVRGLPRSNQSGHPSF